MIKDIILAIANNTLIMGALITYGGNHGNPFIIQLNFNAIKSIHIYNWDTSDIDAVNEPYIIAVWKVKSLKPKPITRPYTIDTSFSLN
jgi:hypothetical protein